MRFDEGIIGWSFWALVLAFLLGARPWNFPADGSYLLEDVQVDQPVRSGS